MDRPSVDYLNKSLRYDYGTGRLFWRHRADMPNNWNSRWARKETAESHCNGYRSVSINYISYTSHKVIWAMHYGYWPDGQIDHINGNKTDNRIENLRLATASENQCNKTKLSNNTSGYKGVSFHKNRGKWVAHIKLNRKKYHIGVYRCPTAAYFAYLNASQKLHGEFAKG